MKRCGKKEMDERKHREGCLRPASWWPRPAARNFQFGKLILYMEKIVGY